MAPNLNKNNTSDILLTAADATTDNLTISSFSLKNQTLTINNHPILHNVPSNITLTPSSKLLPCFSPKSLDLSGSFIGFESPTPHHRHVTPIGQLLNTPFMSIFRFKVWWTTHWSGSNASDLQYETQLLLLDRDGSRSPYVLLLPILEPPFRSSLQPGEFKNNNIDLCVESGSTKIKATSFRTSLYLHAGDDPFTLIRDAVRVVRYHLGTFKLLEEKTPPPIVDRFGWCTWDAFYLKVNPTGVREGVKLLTAGGTPPGFVLIDDGWQSICRDGDDPEEKEGMELTSAGEQMPCRLVKFEENDKFKGMGEFVKGLKREFGSVKEVYVWHALCGYWGGVRPGMERVGEVKVVEPKLSQGLEKTMEDLAVDKIVENGVGLVAPDKVGELYEGLHSHLQAVGIDGVKVDVIHVSLISSYLLISFLHALL